MENLSYFYQLREFFSPRILTLHTLYITNFRHFYISKSDINTNMHARIYMWNKSAKEGYQCGIFQVHFIFKLHWLLMRIEAEM